MGTIDLKVNTAGMSYSQIAALSFYQSIQNQLLVDNKNWLAVIVGGTGSGKSYSAMSIAKHIYPKFNCKYIVHNPLMFVELLQNKELIVKGSVIIFDEAGVGMSSREWFTQQNKLLGIVLQTFRYLNIGVIFTVPRFKFVDNQARGLFHHVLKTESLDKSRGICTLVVWDIINELMQDEPIFRHPVFIIDNEKVHMRTLEVDKPPIELCNEYEGLHKTYKDDIIQNVKLELLNQVHKIEKKRDKARKLEKKGNTDSNDTFDNVNQLPFNDDDDKGETEEGEGKNGGFFDFG